MAEAPTSKTSPLAGADADGDGIPDARDTCGRDAEDLDGYQDADGCPDRDDDGDDDDDDDGDGIPDEQDQCAMLAETRNGVDDADGCPDDAAVVPSPSKAAEETFLRGRELMKQKSYAAACAAFEDSQRLEPAAGTQYNLAGCYVAIAKSATPPPAVAPGPSPRPKPPVRTPPKPAPVDIGESRE